MNHKRCPKSISLSITKTVKQSIQELKQSPLWLTWLFQRHGVYRDMSNICDVEFLGETSY